MAKNVSILTKARLHGEQAQWYGFEVSGPRCTPLLHNLILLVLLFLSMPTTPSLLIALKFGSVLTHPTLGRSSNRRRQLCPSPTRTRSMAGLVNGQSCMIFDQLPPPPPPRVPTGCRGYLPPVGSPWPAGISFHALRKLKHVVFNSDGLHDASCRDNKFLIPIDERTCGPGSTFLLPGLRHSCTRCCSAEDHHSCSSP